LESEAKTSFHAVHSSAQGFNLGPKSWLRILFCQSFGILGFNALQSSCHYLGRISSLPTLHQRRATTKVDLSLNDTSHKSALSYRSITDLQPSALSVSFTSRSYHMTVHTSIYCERLGPSNCPLNIGPFYNIITRHLLAFAERRPAKSTPKRAVLQLSQWRPHEQA
jgi:hypothetical protein